MGRWEPNARGRLAEAAMTLYAEQGFEKTTTAEIAARAGLKERSFFRHFTDKREVLFYGMDWLRELFVRTVADAPPSATAMDAVCRALEAAAARAEENAGLVRARTEIVSASAELRERELAKLAELAEAVAGALRGRGVTEAAATLAAETGIAVYKVAFTRWIGQPGQPDLAAILGETIDQLESALARTAVPA